MESWWELADTKTALKDGFFGIITTKKTSSSLEFELVFKGHWEFWLAMRVGGITGKNKNEKELLISFYYFAWFFYPCH